jgi:hypothetical protein
MRILAFAAALMLAPAAFAQSSPAESQFQLGKSSAPAPRSATSPCRDAAGSFAGCGYNSRTGALAPPRYVSATARLATGDQPSGAVGAPVGSTARCLDDSFSTAALPQDACVDHGGVADWLRSPQ